MKKSIRFIFVFIIIFSFIGCGQAKLTTNTELNGDTNKESKTLASEVDVNSGSEEEQDTEYEYIEDTEQIEENEIEINPEKIIVIDPGHADRSNLEKEAIAPGSTTTKIKDGGGAVGFYTKTPEYLVNMNVAMYLKTELENIGYKIIMTKTDNSISLGNIERAEIGNQNNADLVIRIHADSNNDHSAYGASMLVPSISSPYTTSIYERSRYYGETIINSYCEELGMRNRGISERQDITGFNFSKVPVVLIEMGFLSNENEDNLLSSDEFQRKAAIAIKNGIVKAMN
ncbi:MAG: N-acetylmuramoyl-L-alanine amidase [Clostridiaceae bacterium]